jgi:hypothetical protein
VTDVNKLERFSRIWGVSRREGHESHESGTNLGGRRENSFGEFWRLVATFAFLTYDRRERTPISSDTLSLDRRGRGRLVGIHSRTNLSQATRQHINKRCMLWYTLLSESMLKKRRVCCTSTGYPEPIPSIQMKTTTDTIDQISRLCIS